MAPIESVILERLWLIAESLISSFQPSAVSTQWLLADG